MQKNFHIFLALALLMITFVGSEGQDRAFLKPIIVKPEDERVVIPKGLEVPVLLPQEISSEEPFNLTGIVASDVRSENLVVIGKGEHVRLNPAAAQGPKRLCKEGALGIDVDSVHVLTGEEIGLTGHMDVNPPPDSYNKCYLVYLAPWMKGPNATVPTGTLLPAFVAERVELPAIQARSASAELIRERRARSNNSPQTFFIYELARRDLPASPYPPQNPLKVDTRKVAKLDPGWWNCFAVAGPVHRLEFHKKEFVLDSIAAEQPYLKVILGPDGRLVDIVQTPGFELEGQTLRLSNTRQEFQTDCW